ncbi:hypothetical protein SAMN04488074_106243 [Lentzea albidocapillata subsp. violacea]|uniref:Uncharacterized protein n=2 Tax=Lentzea albidocapillata TaxID=40571 RepID=A0A1G9DF70_9PSEU|nr:hypothetical protein SAMN04488074_106243 [Lentzea albidocapillata subsp. violacea]
MGRGDIVEARELATSSLRIKEKFNDLLGIAVSVELLALISVVTGSASNAALLLGGADRVRQSIGLPLFGSANLAASHNQCVALCRQALGPEQYEEHFSRGAAMTVPSVVAAAQS